MAFFVSCITVNVNFPESAVQRAADDFVRDLYRDTASNSTSTPAVEPAEKTTEKSTEKGLEKKKKKDLKQNTQTSKTSFFQNISFTFLPHAFAQDLNMSSPKAKEIRGRMGSRVAEIITWKQKGIIGENFEAELVIRDLNAIPKQDKSRVEKLISDENSDRKELYEDIQKVNSIEDRKQTKIRKFFGNAFRQNSPAGTWIENDAGSWTRK